MNAKQYLTALANEAREKCGFTGEFRDWILCQAESAAGPIDGVVADLAQRAKFAPRKLGAGFSSECQDWLTAKAKEPIEKPAKASEKTKT